jgi:hypothetical protein
MIAATFGAPLQQRALAKSKKQADPQPLSMIDPHAVNSLKAMSAYLRTLQSFQVKAVLSTARWLW